MEQRHPGDQEKKRRMDMNADAGDFAQFSRPFHGGISKGVINNPLTGSAGEICLGKSARGRNL
jgi:hypothetical protein